MSYKLTSLENHLFTYDEWEDFGPMCNCFFNVKLLTQIGQFPSGTEFESAFIYGDKSTLNFYDKDENEYVFELKLTVGRQLTSDEVKLVKSVYQSIDHSECGCEDHGD